MTFKDFRHKDSGQPEPTPSAKEPNSYSRTVGDAVWKVLKPRGFKRRHNTFVRESEETFEVVNIQGSTHSTNADTILTINLGVYYKILDDLQGKPYKANPKEYDCHYRTRIGHLLQPPGDKWWSIDGEVKAQAVASEIAAAVENQGLRALEAMKTVHGARAVVAAGMGTAHRLTESFRKYLADGN